MSMHLNFEPHSWYRGFAIQKLEVMSEINPTETVGNIWNAYTDNGMTYRIDTLTALTLTQLKQLITEYRSK